MGAKLNGKVLSDDEVLARYETWEGDVPASRLGHAPVSADVVFPFQILGHCDNTYYFLGSESRTVVGYGPEQITKNRLLSLAPLQFWERMYGNRSGIAWDMALNAVLSAAHKTSIYDPSRVRGRGAWHENGKAVLHLGDSIVSGGVKTPIMQVRQGRYIYQLASPLEIEYEDPLNTDEAAEIIKIMELISWENPISANLLAGWCVLAPICGALSWRPHLWISGSKGCGKSWVVDKIVRRLMGNLGLHVQSATTEAGIRQTLGHDALAVTFDEAESNSPRAGDRIQMVMELMRQASSEGGSAIVKGSAGGVARSYKIRSCFLMSSIGIGIKQAADASRVSVLSIVKRKDKGEFEEMQRLTASTLTEEYVRRFIARSIYMIPEIRANATTFAKAAGAVLGSQRAGDQIGALLAGWYSLYRDDIVTLEEAEAWIKGQDWTEQKQVEEDTDEDGLLQYLLAQVIKVQVRTFNGERSIGEVAMLAAGSERMETVTTMDATDILGRIGMKTDAPILGVPRLIISNSHPGIGKILAGTQWATGWARILKRVDGAVAVEPTRFGAQHRSRGVSVPLLEG